MGCLKLFLIKGFIRYAASNVQVFCGCALSIVKCFDMCRVERERVRGCIALWAAGLKKRGFAYCGGVLRCAESNGGESCGCVLLTCELLKLFLLRDLSDVQHRTHGFLRLCYLVGCCT